jgi:hypothetical protein
MSWIRCVPDKHHCLKPVFPRGYARGSQWQCDECGSVWTLKLNIDDGLIVKWSRS